VSKDKKKKKDKKDGKASGQAANPAISSLKALAQNPVVAEVVAAALVATAAALKDPKKARKLAEDSGDQVSSLAAKGSERGDALWKLAMDVGRSALEAFAEPGKPSKKAK